MNKVIGEIFETTEYEMFKTLEGNRTDAKVRAKKVIESIKNNGYILSPIAVNEHYEVVDGQARLCALKELGLPVHYYFAPGATINDCIAMNIYGTRWSMYDYINSHAERGNKNYILLRNLYDAYIKKFHFPVIICALTNKYGDHSTLGIKAGEFQITEEQYSRTVNRLDEMTKIQKSISWVPGNKDYFLMAYNFIVNECKGVDKGKLVNRLELMSGNLRPAVSVKSALQSISEVYNWKSQAENRRYFETEYDKYMCIKTSGYYSRWSDEKNKKYNESEAI